MVDPQNQRLLHDVKVLVTRPEQRAAGLCGMIERAGGVALHFAAIEIGAPANVTSREYAREHIGDFAVAIFISPTAVEETLDFLGTPPDGLRIAAIGSRTAAMLESHGLHIDIMPDGHDSESLLQHPDLQQERLDGANIVIFRGEGGRDLLGDTLRSRGAAVFYADMYRRSPPVSSDRLDHYLNQANIITVSSNEGLQNLYDLASDKNNLTRLPIVVPGKRAYTLAKTLGFSKIHAAENATDGAFIQALESAIQELSKKQ